jgi:hypothetical protein
VKPAPGVMMHEQAEPTAFLKNLFTTKAFYFNAKSLSYF